MPLFQLFLIAVIQGVTEFLPISSSGHLILLPGLTGLADQGQMIDVSVHVGTLGAVMIYFGYLMCALQVESDQSTLILQIPTVYLYAVLPLMGVMMILRVLMVMREDILNQRAQAKR